MRDSFSSLHPIINFYFFCVVLLITMLVMHPIFLATSLFSAAFYAIYQKGRKALKFQLCGVLPLIILMAISNPLFNHAGMTILFYLSNGNPVTLESVAYGASAAVMFASVIIWFSCYNNVMTSDKFIYLFGRVIPSLSLLLSMALRFVPRFKEQIKEVTSAQRMIGNDVSKGNILKRVICAMKILSITVTWALENAVTTADSMKSRGYGHRGRTAYSIYSFYTRDKLLLAAMLLLSVGFIAFLLSGTIYMRYFPSIKQNHSGVLAIAGYVFYGVFCNIPMLLNLKEEYTWTSLQQKI